MANATSERMEPLSIDRDDLRHALEDERLGALLAAAEAEGEAVESEGRQRW